jgi:long-chain-fatty-acid--[acyl-carrier-protein] ligase
VHILTVLKKNFKKLKNLSVCYDQLFGVQSARDFLIKAYLIADILKTFPGKKVAIMLPSLSATSLLIIACYLAEKIPVMLNWTQSEEAFAHCVKSQEIAVILTAGSFFKKIQTPWLKKYEMTFFEELLKKVSLGQKIKALVKALLFQLPHQVDETAVVLFTSGSEALPKTVVLTHQNILQDLKGATELLAVRNDDILLAFLPPFHSF